jgi:hypothetical protein
MSDTPEVPARTRARTARKRRRWTLLAAAGALAVTLLIGPPIIWTSCVRALQAGDGPGEALVYGSYRNGLRTRPTRVLLTLSGPDGKSAARLVIDPQRLQCFEWRWPERPPEGAPLGALSPELLAAKIGGDHADVLAPPLDRFIRHIAASNSRAMADPFPSYPEELERNPLPADPGRWYAISEEPGIQLGPQVARPAIIWIAAFSALLATPWIFARARAARSKQLPT